MSEMKKFFVLVIAMGLLTQMDVSEYWAVNPVTATLFFHSVMSRDRFLLLLTFIHLNDNKEYILRGTAGHNPFFKLGPLYHRILAQFRSVYSRTRPLQLTRVWLLGMTIFQFVYIARISQSNMD